MKLWNLYAAGLIAGLSSQMVMAEQVGIASFNLAWAGTKADFENHIAVCSSPEVNWCDTRAKIQKDSNAPTKEEEARAKQCQSAFETVAGGLVKGMMVAPCNAYKLNATKWAAGSSNMYVEKLQGLANTIDHLVSTEKISVFAFQEVKSNDVIQTILGKNASQFDSCIATHSAFQTVGFAWKKSLTSKPGQCKIETGLAIKENPNDAGSLRTLRPGIELRLNIGANEVSFLNVHLKSACANLITGGGFPGHELTDSNPACQILNRQVVPLENWIERVAVETPMFVILGDFNRRLDEEAAKDIPKNKVRLDGTDPASPNKTGTLGQVTSRVLWQEISDGNPGLVQVPLSDAATGCKGFNGLDHILLSESLRSKQVSPLSSTKLPVNKVNNQKIETSDHCPRITTLNM